MGNSFADEIRSKYKVNNDVSFDYNSFLITASECSYEAFLEGVIKTIKERLRTESERLSSYTEKELAGYCAVGIPEDMGPERSYYPFTREQIIKTIEKSAGVIIPNNCFEGNKLYIEKDGRRLLDSWPEAADVWKNLLTKGPTRGTVSSPHHSVNISLQDGKIVIRREGHYFALYYDDADCKYLEINNRVEKTGIFRKRPIDVPELTDLGKKVVKDIATLAEKEGIEIKPIALYSTYMPYDDYKSAIIKPGFSLNEPITTDIYGQSGLLGIHFRIVL